MGLPVNTMKCSHACSAFDATSGIARNDVPVLTTMFVFHPDWTDDAAINVDSSILVCQERLSVPRLDGPAQIDKMNAGCGRQQLILRWSFWGGAIRAVC